MDRRDETFHEIDGMLVRQQYYELNEERGCACGTGADDVVVSAAVANKIETSIRVAMFPPQRK